MLGTVDVIVPRRSSVFSHSSVQISAGLTDISGWAVAAFDHIPMTSTTGVLIVSTDVTQITWL